MIRLLEQAERQQWVIVDVQDRPYLNGRIGQRVRVMDDRVLVVVDDAEAVDGDPPGACPRRWLAAGPGR